MIQHSFAVFDREAGSLSHACVGYSRRQGPTCTTDAYFAAEALPKRILSACMGGDLQRRTVMV